MKVHQAHFRALVVLDQVGVDTSRGYPNHTRALMVEAHCPGPPGSVRYFPAQLAGTATSRCVPETTRS
jgi:hypothetical protein